MHKVIEIELDSQITLWKNQFTDGILFQIRKFLTLDNPKFVDAEKHGRYTGDIERFIFAYTEDENHLYCLRGYLGSLLPFLCRNGLKYKIIDRRRKLDEIDLSFRGELRSYQQRAVMDALQKHFGVLVAPCGSGKTIMAAAVMAERRQPTLVIVHTKELMNQWVERISYFLGIPAGDIGIIGAGKENIKPITVGMVQTLCKRDLDAIREHFGFIILDECHHVPSTTFTEVVSAFDSFYMLGLSATPYRRDRLNKLIYASMGNLVAEVRDSELQQAGVKIKPEIIVRETGFDFDYDEDSDYQPMISALVEDEDRNDLIASDVIQEASSNGNSILVLSDRKSHLSDLEALLRGQGIEGKILTADVPKKQRAQIIQDFESGALRVVLATGQLAGEGLDIPRLNRLFVTTPIKWKGRILQYAGRALRVADGKHDARIYDYVDMPGVLQVAYRSRRRVYASLN